MAKKVFLGVGHGGSDPGAVANGLREKDLNLSIALTCQDELARHGVLTKMSRSVDEDESLTTKIKECNAFDPDLALDIHINAGGGDGVEVFHTYKGGTGKLLAVNIIDEAVKIGQNSRGTKTKKNSSGSDYYGFIRQTDAPAVIVECAFIDNAKDIQIIDTPAEQAVFGVAIAKGILKTLGIAYIEASEKHTSSGSTAEKLTVDGQWGKQTTTATQKVLGTPVDGIVSNQARFYKKYVPAALTSSWEFKDSGYSIGSALIKAIQTLIGATVDGLCGNRTVKAMQNFLKKKGYYNYEVDGYMGEKTVRGWQQYINSRL